MSTNARGHVVGLCLEPLDVLFFRDGRPFMAGTEHMVSGLPLPQTLAGAIRTALLRAAGCDFRRFGDAQKNGAAFADAVQQSCEQAHHWIGEVIVRGPWLARRRNGTESVEVLVPVPATLHREKHDRDQLHRLLPLKEGQLPGWNPSDYQRALRPLWLRHLPATEPASGYLTRNGLEQFLRAEQVDARYIVTPEALFALDHRTGIGINSERLVAEESQIFGRGFLALNPGFREGKRDESLTVFLYAEVAMPTGGCLELFDGIKTLPLGGEGRHVLVHRVAPFSWPVVKPNDRQKPLVLLTTPCAFEAGWKPRAFSGLLVSAAVPGSLAYSGWDLARGGPKPTRFAVPAGSVYFLNEDWSGRLAENEEDHRQGWGCFLKGVWHDD
ncbi:MAG TPA: type III-B CRISPR module-associated protein Cmr3 [Tepidisphaeraceae bacterium]|nr:type III-B CRISPR module-associated protein Cmr3 [Tepidisphaeraceae bacterium]